MPGEKSIHDQQTQTEPHELMLRLLLIGQVLISIEMRLFRHVSVSIVTACLCEGESVNVLYIRYFFNIYGRSL